jgi:SanA protein
MSLLSKHTLGIIKKLVIIVAIVSAIGVIAIGSINIYMIKKYEDYILTPEEARGMDADCIMVLGARVFKDEKPSLMLNDRLEKGVELYNLGVSDRLLMTGDHGRLEYDEVNAMKAYAINQGIEADTVFMDHAGFSTYESMFRAKEVFEVKRMIVVTQEYHLYRALYLANELGIESYGVHADIQEYAGQKGRDYREIAARVKDFFYIIFKPDPTYLGDVIPISESGELTDD